MAKQLIEGKADVNLRAGVGKPKTAGKTPLEVALERKNWKGVAVLLEAGCEVDVKDICILVRAEGPRAVQCLETYPKAATWWGATVMQRFHIWEQLRVVVEKGDMYVDQGSQKIAFFCSRGYISLKSQNLFTRPEVQATLKHLPSLSASDACNPELLEALTDTTNDEVFSTHTVAALVQAAWMQTRFATACEVFVSLLLLPLLCHVSFTLRHEQPRFTDPGH